MDQNPIQPIQPAQPIQQPAEPVKSKNWLKWVLILLVFVVVGSGAYLLATKQYTPQKKSNPTGQQATQLSQSSGALDAQSYNYQSKSLASFQGYTNTTEPYLNNCVFSPSGFQVACIKNYIGGNSLKESVVLNGVEGKQYEQIKDLQFSPDGKRLGYIASVSQAKEWFVVIDSIEQKHYEYAGELTFSPDSKHFAYSIGKNSYPVGTAPFIHPAYKQMVMVVDDKEGKEFKGLTSAPGNEYIPVFSPDSQNILFSAYNDLESMLVINDQEIAKDSPKLQFVNPRFSMDGQKIVAVLVDPTDYSGASTGVEVLDTKGNIISKYKNPVLWNKDYMSINFDGSKLAYVAKEPSNLLGSADTLFVNDQAVKKSNDSIWNPSLSSDGSSLVYISLETGPNGVMIKDNNTSPTAHIILNDKEIDNYRTFDSRVSHFVFSKNGKYLAYLIAPSNNPNTKPSASKLVVATSDKTCFIPFSGTLSSQNALENQSTTAELQDPNFSPDGESVGFGLINNGSLIWNVGKIDMTSCKLT